MFAMSLGALLLIPTARAGTLALDIIASTPFTNASWSAGWQFIVNSPITVDGLAFYDNTADENHVVGIYNDATQALLVSTTVTTANCPIGTAPWCVQSVAPYALGVGTYDIMAVTGDDSYPLNVESLTVIPQITYVGDEVYLTPNLGVLTFPNFSSTNLGTFGPSFTVSGASSVPEPAAVLLTGGGLLLAAGLRSRRRGRAR